MNFSRIVPAVAILSLAACGVATDSNTAGISKQDAGGWIAAWGAPANGSAAGPANATARNIVRPTIGGSRLRIRLANIGAEALNVGAATVAVVDGGAGIVAGTLKTITFGGARSISVPAGTDYLYSDAVDFPVVAQQDLAISLFLPDPATSVTSGAAWSTSFVSADGTGDQTAEADGAAFGPIGGSNQAPAQTPLVCSGCSTIAVTAIDVISSTANSAVGAIGSSTFHGNNSTRDSHNRVLDQISVRINGEIPAGRQKGIVSAGIGGDTLHAGLDRMERDVYSQSGVGAVMVYDVNDLSSRTYEQIRDDYLILIRDSHARGIKVYCSTWPPAGQSAPAKPTQERSKLNTWILNSGACDAVVDWDAVLRSDVAPDEYRADYFSDGIHPNDAGHTAMAQAVPVAEWYGY